MSDGPKDDFVLPPLREELRIEMSAPLLTGAPSWVVYDPVRHRYFQLSRRVVDILSAWRAGTVGALSDYLHREKGMTVDRQELKGLIGFLYTNELTSIPMTGRSADFADRAAKAKRAGLLALAKAYLFFRIPLVRPDRFLEQTLPTARLFYSRGFVVLVVLAGIMGLGLAMRQLDAFLSYAQRFFTLEGAASYALAIVVVKICHELGHAYQAKMRGINVPSMGIAFMVMFPLLYTDVSDAWRTRNRRDKLMIDAGGVLVELCLAAIATLVWVFLPDGPVRLIAFSIATTSWVLSLFVNLNPFLRFDGYYFLSDATGLQNLQPRSFALFRWALREALFGLGHAPPERVNRRTRRFMVGYATLTAIYRIFLFIGIALLVYHLFFKALGVLLFVIEIVFFILLPIVREVTAWVRLRAEIVRSRRAWVTGGIFAALLGLFLWPMPVVIHAPAVLVYENEIEVFPPVDGQIVVSNMDVGQVVKAGELLMRVSSPELDSQIERAEKQNALLEVRIARTVADQDERASRRILQREREAIRSQLDGLREQRSNLDVKARIDGVLLDITSEAKSSVWVGRGQRLARIVDPSGVRLRGYVAEHDLSRIAMGSPGLFVPDDPVRASFNVQLADISDFAVAELRQEYLSSQNGGAVVVEPVQDESGVLRPMGSWFAISAELTTDTVPPLPQVTRGVIVLTGRVESWAYRAILQVARVLVREFGA